MKYDTFTRFSELNDIEFLKRGILLGEGFQLYFVIANTIDVRQKVIKELLETKGILVKIVEGTNLSEQNLASVIIDSFHSLSNFEGRPVVILTEIEELVAENPRLINRFNEERNELVSNVSGVVVIIGSEELIEMLRRAAPDVWSIRSADVESNIDTGYSASSQNDHILKPITPPKGENERVLLEKQFNELLPGDRRGRVAFRLAEIGPYVGFHSKRVAELYVDASYQISDPWSSTLARINAARAFTEAKSYTQANTLLDDIDKIVYNLDPAIQAYYLQSRIHLNVVQDGFSQAIDHANLAVKNAYKSGDLDLLSESRLDRAIVFIRIRELTKAIKDIKAAEEDATRIGNLTTAQKARLLLGEVSVSAGYIKQASTAWQRYVDQEKTPKVENFIQLVKVVDELEQRTEGEAANQAWKILLSLTDEKACFPTLIESITMYAWRVIIWQNRRYTKFSLWLDRINSLSSEYNEEKEASFLLLQLLEARDALLDSDLKKVSAILFSWQIAREKAVQLNPFFPIFASLITVCYLQMIEHTDEAMRVLVNEFRKPISVIRIMEYLSDHARRINKFSDMPKPEGIVTSLLIDSVGGLVGARYIVDLLTGGTATTSIDTFFTPTGEMHLILPDFQSSP
jgi:hypothetical protein